MMRCDPFELPFHHTPQSGLPAPDVRILPLPSGHNNGRCGKIPDPAGMIVVEMGDNNSPNGLWRNPHLLQLRNGGLRWLEL